MAAKSIACRCGKRTASTPTWHRSPPTFAGGPSYSCSTIRTARPARWPGARSISKASISRTATARMPGGTYFLYVPAPQAAGERRFGNAEEISQFLIQEQSVCCVPWDDAGPFLRFSVTYLAKDETEEDTLMRETVERLGRLKLCFG